MFWRFSVRGKIWRISNHDQQGGLGGDVARVQIALPEQWLFTVDLMVRVGDVNYGGHLGNDRVLALVQEARVRWLRARSLSEIDVGGAGLIMADAAVLYRGQAFLGDVLRASLGVTEISRSGFDLVVRLTRPHNQAEIAVAKTGMVCFDYVTGRPVRVPLGLLAYLRADT